MNPGPPHVARLAALVVACLSLAAARGACQDAPVLRATPAVTVSPWERSLALEAEGKLAQARQVLVDAFGPRPVYYEPAVRLAWLSFSMRDGAAAVELYRHARTLPGSLPEATTGLGLALTMRGYAELARGAFGAARGSWNEALAIDAANADARAGVDILGGPEGVTIEAWGAALSATSGSSRASVLYAQLPARLNNALAVRVALRQVSSPTFVGTKGVFSMQTELFGGIARDLGISTTELIAFSLAGSTYSHAGVALATRVGGTFGVTGTASVIGLASGTNVQFAPMVFAWLSPHVSLSGGVRITSDPALSAVSPIAAATLRSDRVALDVVAHAGKERWAFSDAGPTILSFLDNTSGGATGTLSWLAGRRVRVFAQVQVEQTVSSGSYGSIGVGVRVTPR